MRTRGPAGTACRLPAQLHHARGEQRGIAVAQVSHRLLEQRRRAACLPCGPRFAGEDATSPDVASIAPFRGASDDFSPLHMTRMSGGLMTKRIRNGRRTELGWAVLLVAALLCACNGTQGTGGPDGAAGGSAGAMAGGTGGGGTAGAAAGRGGASGSGASGSSGSGSGGSGGGAAGAAAGRGGASGSGGAAGAAAGRGGASGSGASGSGGSGACNGNTCDASQRCVHPRPPPCTMMVERCEPIPPDCVSNCCFRPCSLDAGLGCLQTICLDPPPPPACVGFPSGCLSTPSSTCVCSICPGISSCSPTNTDVWCF